MGVKINFINPFGTDAYNGLIMETMAPYLTGGAELVVSNTKNCPENIDYYYNKHLIEEAIFESCIDAEKAGFDAVIVGCCYDPGVRVARELVDIPVIGPLEATMQLAPYYGHEYVLVTDHHKAVPYLRDMVRLYGEDAHCRKVDCIDWWVTDMIQDTAGVARDAVAAATKIRQEAEADVCILGCTIISASYEKSIMEGAPRDVSILNPNTMALKLAQSLAELKQQGAYAISRRAYYQNLKDRNAEEFSSVRKQFANRKPNL
ncbi:hydantoin racemase|uniref:Hydantoin racemase n=1 Tax=Pseudomonas fluorescens TaxID=294 RepID=A0A5E7HXZ9_PSEFL|nr:MULTISPECIES: aspartate/glutamate racemase family protein [Pseudomonas]NYU05671.1 hydantoin racemase [Pseudomonas sp. SbOxS1]VVO67217.1 Hydantoin racemase [Pseudomonas fluorescens]